MNTPLQYTNLPLFLIASSSYNHFVISHVGLEIQNDKICHFILCSMLWNDGELVLFEPYQHYHDLNNIRSLDWLLVALQEYENLVSFHATKVCGNRDFLSLKFYSIP